MLDPLYGMALATGFLGSGHCLGMCGGMVAALSLLGGQKSGPLFHLLYNGGRLLTYTLIGLAVGWLGALFAYTEALHGFARYLLLVSDLLVIFIGLGTTGLLGQLGSGWLGEGKSVALLTAGVRRIGRWPAALAAFPLGMLMGFIPCGFLYAMVLTAAQGTGPLRGGLTMLAFGLGTAPALLLFGRAAAWLSTATRRRLLQIAGVLVVLMGLLNLYRHLTLIGCCQGIPALL